MSRKRNVFFFKQQVHSSQVLRMLEKTRHLPPVRGHHQQKLYIQSLLANIPSIRMWQGFLNQIIMHGCTKAHTRINVHACTVSPSPRSHFYHGNGNSRMVTTAVAGGKNTTIHWALHHKQCQIVQSLLIKASSLATASLFFFFDGGKALTMWHRRNLKTIKRNTTIKPTGWNLR